jgi:hypothetical protein
LDSYFSNEHAKTVEKMKKIKSGSSHNIVLPLLYNKSNFSSSHVMTEPNKLASKKETMATLQTSHI